MTTKPLVAIVGRPNVGKSTFFNKIAGHRVAIVEDTPGVTRDRIYADVEWTGREFTLIDTGGIDPRSDDVLLSQMRRQAEIAIEMADVICFFCDARDGLTRDDEEVASLLRRKRKPVILVVNKLDYAGLNDVLYEYYALGLGEPVGISAANMLGLGDLLDEIVKLLPPKREDEEEDENGLHEIQLALVGRPNVGKSSLTNRLLGQERVMVSDIPGTTRDAIDTHFESQYGGRYNIIDTAGIRRKRAVEDQSLERYSVLRAIAAIRRCDVALLVIDAVDGVTEQDTKIAGIIAEEGKAVIVVVNKWDLVENKDQKVITTFETAIRNRMAPFVDFPIIFASALTKQRIFKVLETAKQVYQNRKAHIGTSKLNEVMLPIIEAYPPQSVKGKYIKIKYCTQLPNTTIPSFVFYANLPQYVKENYRRFLENKIRENWSLHGCPINIFIRQK